ncbi:uncharacterized protein JCM15063_001399 [Sporobolomyces koalae]|uniref:uncharacterized protein n=1 Tax=Sporobolomyces koalae TaxID=500713 RepID=UPI0031729B45
MDFICLSFGCSKQYSQEDGQAHLCPRCNNGQVYAVKEWQASQKGPAPPIAQQGGYYPPQQQQQQPYGAKAPMGYPQQPMQPQ